MTFADLAVGDSVFWTVGWKAGRWCRAGACADLRPQESARYVRPLPSVQGPSSKLVCIEEGP